ncbi:MAG: hypothetical protein HKN15_03520 [Xanthomonadales bacterium]|nr:hypothetical protein [Xanthomonadales bacterium]
MIDPGMGWAIFGVSFIFIFILIGILAESQRQKSKLARQELLQKERLAAIEKGIPLPDWDTVMLDEDGSLVSSAEAHERRRQWFRMLTLALGLLMCFAGIGMLFAFNIGADNDFRDIGTIGAIPIMAGIGLLLFYALTRKEPN